MQSMTMSWQIKKHKSLTKLGKWVICACIEFTHKSHVPLNSFKGKSVKCSKVSFENHKTFWSLPSRGAEAGRCIALYTYRPQKALRFLSKKNLCVFWSKFLRA